MRDLDDATRFPTQLALDGGEVLRGDGLGHLAAAGASAASREDQMVAYHAESFEAWAMPGAVACVSSGSSTV